MAEFGEAKGVPPVILCVMGGLIIFTLIATFTGLEHLADEMILVGGVAGLLLYVTGVFDLLSSETSSVGGGGW